VTSTASNVSPSLRVCVGNHFSTSSTNLFSKHPKIATTRGYRAYRIKDADANSWQSKGIGESDEKITCTGAVWQQYRYIAQQFINHQFVYATIGASAKDTDCATPLTELSGNTQFYISQNAPVPNPTTVTTTTTSRSLTAQNNPGRLYCMSADDGVSCPALSVTESTPSTTVKGTITALNGATFTGIASSAVGNGRNTTCSTATWQDNSNGTYSYTCVINWSGFIGTDWSGTLPFTASGTNTLCAEGASHVVTPNTASIAYTISDRTASTNPNSVVFTNIPRSVTEILLNMQAKSVACTGLGQPVVEKENGSNTGWKWPSVTNADQYKVFTCSATGTTACTLPTTPSVTSAALTSANTFTNNTANSSQTRCIAVIASHSSNIYADGVASITKCLTHTVTASKTGKLSSSYSSPFSP
jgi:hypothetical protein